MSGELLPLHKRFTPGQRSIAAQQVCPTCLAKKGKPCLYVERDDRLGKPMPGFHVARYPTHA